MSPVRPKHLRYFGAIQNHQVLTIPSLRVIRPVVTTRHYSLAKLLPEIVDKLTPNGTLPEGGLLQGLDAIKKNFLGS